MKFLGHFLQYVAALFVMYLSVAVLAGAAAFVAITICVYPLVALGLVAGFFARPTYDFVRNRSVGRTSHSLRLSVTILRSLVTGAWADDWFGPGMRGPLAH